MDNGAFFSVKKDNKYLPISTVALAGLTNFQYLYVGTADGVYSTSTSAYQISAVAMDGTAGHPFKRVVGAGSSQIAALSNHIIVLSSYGSSVVLPLAAISLGDVNAIAIDPSGNILVVAGSEGLMVVQMPNVG